MYNTQVHLERIYVLRRFEIMTCSLCKPVHRINLMSVFRKLRTRHLLHVSTFLAIIG